MRTPFKMKGMSFGNSPLHQDKKVTPVEENKPKYRLISQTNAKTGKTTYSKISGGSSTDGGKTFTPTVEIKISETEYNSLKGQ
jgi:hypothetical protein